MLNEPIRKMKKYIVEFIGTFFLILAIGMLVLGGADSHFVPIGIGATLIGVIFAGGHISKAHYNPAVTLAFYLRGRINVSDGMGYVVAQLLASFAATGATFLMLPEVGHINEMAFEPLSLVVAEFLGTFMLVFVILNVATSKGTFDNQFYGMAIGLTVIGLIYMFGNVSGAIFNPAVTIGFVIMGLMKMVDIWLYFLVQFVAAAVATFVFLFVNGRE